MAEMKTLNGYEIVDEKARNEIFETPTDSKYFDIDYDGIVSLKPAYRGRPASDVAAAFPFSESDMKAGNDGSLNHELPKRIVFPEVIDDTAVTGFVNGMFANNYAVEEIVLPKSVSSLPRGFLRYASNVRVIKNTEHITKLEQTAILGCLIEEALFPNLKELGPAALSWCPYLYVVDIGNEITEIPQKCFNENPKLSYVKGGEKVTKIGVQAFENTYNLKNLSFLPQVTSIGNKAFYQSRIQFDWSTLTNCTFGTNATPVSDNTTDYWSDCTYPTETHESRLVTKLHDENPEWKEEQWGTSGIPYSLGCAMFTMMHIHSGMTGVKYNHPKEFENLVASLPSGSTFLSSHPGNWEQNKQKFVELGQLAGYTTEAIDGTLTQSDFQKVMDALSNGGYVYVSVSTSDNVDGGHAVAAYGINSNKEVLFIDSDATSLAAANIYEAGLYRVPFQNITGPSSNVIIVTKN